MLLLIKLQNLLMISPDGACCEMGLPDVRAVPWLDRVDMIAATSYMNTHMHISSESVKSSSCRNSKVVIV